MALSIGAAPSYDASGMTEHSTPSLRRALTFWPLLFYGIGIIVGAGIYVALGEVVARAGAAAPLSFLLAGIAAGFTGLCYAALASRFPEAAGAAAYAKHGFASDRFAQATGAAVTLATAISAASIAHGAAQYLGILLPLPGPVLVTALVVGFTLIAALGVRESVGLAAVIGALEILGLLAAIGAGLAQWGAGAEPAAMLPEGLAGWHGTLAGAFIAFFAFIGFETLVNLAEETKEPARTLPRGILAAIAVSSLLYIAVAAAAVLGGTAGGNPLVGLFKGESALLFAFVGFLAIANGVLVEIVMLSRLFYGMARREQLPAALAAVAPRTRTPVRATCLAGAIVLAAALLLPFERLIVLANALTLAVFAVVDLALWQVQHRGKAPPGTFDVPRWVPPLGAALALALLLSELL